MKPMTPANVVDAVERMPKPPTTYAFYIQVALGGLYALCNCHGYTLGLHELPPFPKPAREDQFRLALEKVIRKANRYDGNHQWTPGDFRGDLSVVPTDVLRETHEQMDVRAITRTTPQMAIISELRARDVELATDKITGLQAFVLEPEKWRREELIDRLNTGWTGGCVDEKPATPQPSGPCADCMRLGILCEDGLTRYPCCEVCKLPEPLFTTNPDWAEVWYEGMGLMKDGVCIAEFASKDLAERVAYLLNVHGVKP